MPFVDLLLFGALLLGGVHLALGRARRPVLGVCLTAIAAVGLGLMGLLDLRWQAVPGLAVALAGAGLTGLTALWGESRLARRRWMGSLLLVLVAFAALPYWVFPVPGWPAPDGSYPVGVRHFDVVDGDRHGVLYAAGDAPRRFPVTVWYPARADGTPERDYMRRQQALVELVSTARNFGEPGFLWTYYRGVQVHSAPGAPVAESGDGFPVAIFNHGFWSYRAQNTALAERLASHGFIVFSPAHPGDGATVELADGTRLPTVPQFGNEGVGDTAAMERFRETRARLGEARSPRQARAAIADFKEAIRDHRLSESVRAWRADVLALLDRLQQEPGPELTDLLEQADLSRRVHMGMSFGGSTAASTCSVDPACAAVVNLDGENFDPDLFDRALEVPMLLLLAGPGTGGGSAGGAYHPTDHAWRRLDAAGERADHYRLRVDGLRHLGFMDLVVSARPPFRDAYGTLDGARALQLQNDAVVRFLRQKVLGRGGEFPARLLRRYPRFEIHEPPIFPPVAPAP